MNHWPFLRIWLRDIANVLALEVEAALTECDVNTLVFIQAYLRIWQIHQDNVHVFTGKFIFFIYLFIYLLIYLFIYSFNTLFKVNVKIKKTNLHRQQKTLIKWKKNKLIKWVDAGRYMSNNKKMPLYSQLNMYLPCIYIRHALNNL